MPRLSVLFVRTALLYLAMGFTLGALLLMGKGIPAWQPGVWRLLPAHYECLLLGWTLQFAVRCGILDSPPLGAAARGRTVGPDNLWPAQRRHLACHRRVCLRHDRLARRRRPCVRGGRRPRIRRTRLAPRQTLGGQQLTIDN